MAVACVFADTCLKSLPVYTLRKGCREQRQVNPQADLVVDVVDYAL